MGLSKPTRACDFNISHYTPHTRRRLLVLLGHRPDRRGTLSRYFSKAMWRRCYVIRRSC